MPRSCALDCAEEITFDTLLDLALQATQCRPNDGLIDSKTATEKLQKALEVLEDSPSGCSWDHCLLLENIFLRHKVKFEQEKDLDDLIEITTKVLRIIAKTHPREFTVFSQEWILRKCADNLNDQEVLLSSYIMASVDAVLCLSPKALPSTIDHFLGSMRPMLENSNVRADFVVKTFSICIRRFLELCMSSLREKFSFSVLKALLCHTNKVVSFLCKSIGIKDISYDTLYTDDRTNMVLLSSDLIRLYDNMYTSGDHKDLYCNMDVEEDALKNPLVFTIALIHAVKTPYSDLVIDTLVKPVEGYITSILSRFERSVELMLALEAVAVCLSSTKHISTEVGVSRAIFEAMTNVIVSVDDSCIGNRCLKLLRSLIDSKSPEVQLELIFDMCQGEDRGSRHLSLGLYLLDFLIEKFWDHDTSMFNKSNIRATILDHLLDLEGPVFSGKYRKCGKNVLNAAEYLVERCGVVSHLINILMKTFMKSGREENVMWPKEDARRVSSMLLLPLYNHSKAILSLSERSPNASYNPQMLYLNILSFNIERALSASDAVTAAK